MTTSLVGTRDVAAGRNGGPWKKIRDDLDGLSVADFEAHNWGDAFLVVGAAKVTNLDLGPGTITDTYRVLNMGDPSGELSAFRIHDLQMTNLERGGLRFKNVHDGTVEGVTAQSDGRGCNDIPVGFAISNGTGNNVTYRRCIAAGFVQDIGNKRPGAYLNGDGFSDEETNHDLTYEDCAATDNGDAGFDVKSLDVTLTRCRAERNGRNFRLHGSGVLVDCVSIDPRGAHFWFRGSDVTRPHDYTLIGPQFIGDKPHIQIDGATPDMHVTIVDPVVPDGEPLRILLNDDGGQAIVAVNFTVARRPVPVEVTRSGVPGGPMGSVMVTVTEVVTTTATRTYDAEHPDAA